jgi:hypothetical protein
MFPTQARLADSARLSLAMSWPGLLESAKAKKKAQGAKLERACFDDLAMQMQGRCFHSSL